MGKRGPRPTPTAILKTRGSRRAKSRKREPQPAEASSDYPSWLNQDARAAWRELAPQLQTMGVLKQIDTYALARYCHVWARWQKLERTIAEYTETSTIETKNGSYEQQRPEVGIANKLMIILARLEAEFGMTPAARTRVTVTPEKAPADTNPLSALQNEADDE